MERSKGCGSSGVVRNGKTRHGNKGINAKIAVAIIAREMGGQNIVWISA